MNIHKCSRFGVTIFSGNHLEILLNPQLSVSMLKTRNTLRKHLAMDWFNTSNNLTLSCRQVYHPRNRYYADSGVWKFLTVKTEYKKFVRFPDYAQMYVLS